MEKVVIITGASNGIGLSLSKTLIDNSYTVFNLDKVHPHQAVDSIYIECDIRNLEMIKHARNIIKDTLDTKGWKLVSLINNAGVNYLDWIEKISYHDYDRVMDTNVKGTFFTTKIFLPLLDKFKSSVVNIISNAADKPMTCSSIYNASKGAVKIMTREMARELTPKYGITVFGVSPNKILDTEMSKYVDRIVPIIRNWPNGYAHEYEISNIPCRENTPLEIFTDFLAHLIMLEEKNKYLSGNIMEYGV